MTKISRRKFWQENGIVTGGQYNSKQGCQPYKVPACDHYIKGHLKPCEDIFSPQALILTPACEKRCEAGKHHMTAKKEIVYSQCRLPCAFH